MSVGSARKHIFIQPADEFVSWIGEITCYLLLNRSPLLGPSLLGVVDAAQACRLGLESNVDIRRRDGCKVLGDGLLGVGIVPPAELRVDGCRLVRRHSRASSEGHMFLSVSHSRKTSRSLVAPGQEVHFDSHDGSERVADHDHAKAVVQSRPEHRLLLRRSKCARNRKKKAQQQGQKAVSIHFDILRVSIRLTGKANTNAA